MRITRIIAAAVAATVLAVPAAQASVPDMHASTAIAASKKQDLRSPDARDAATVRLHKSGAVVGTTNVAPGQPTWPVNPQPLKVAAPAPAAAPADDGGIDWATIAIGIAGSLLAVGAIALMTNRRSTNRLRASV